MRDVATSVASIGLCWIMQLLAAFAWGHGACVGLSISRARELFVVGASLFALNLWLGSTSSAVVVAGVLSGSAAFVQLLHLTPCAACLDTAAWCANMPWRLPIGVSIGPVHVLVLGVTVGFCAVASAATPVGARGGRLRTEAAVSPPATGALVATIVDVVVALSILLLLIDRYGRRSSISLDFLRDAPLLVVATSLVRIGEGPRWRRALRLALLLPAGLWIYRLFPREFGPQFFQPMSG